MSRGIVAAVLGVALYTVVVYLLPSPLNIMVAPLVSGVLASLWAGSPSRLKAFLAGVAIGVTSYLALLVYTGSLPAALAISLELAGPLGVVAPLLYHGVATGLASVALSGVIRR
ncbi:MAG: hypothetical protein GSR84_01625 [Desulfurococcales archaeon]|nr:hypothetical protein [Desulfurococcales archaeon]